MKAAERFRLLTHPLEGEVLKTRSVRGGLYSMAAEGSDFVLRFASVAVLARLLLPEYFGLISMVTAITVIAERFKDLGLAFATIQQKEITHEQVSTLFWINASIGLVLSLAVAASAPLIAGFYNDPRLVPITMALATTFLFGGLAIQHQALLRRQMMFAHTAIIQICSTILSLALAIGSAFLLPNEHAYWALVVREVSRNVFLAVGTIACFPWLPGRPSKHARVGSMLRLGGDVSAFNLVWFFSSSLDLILLGKFFGPTPVGIYRQGFQLVLAPISQLIFPVRMVAESALSRLQDKPDQYRLFYRKLLTALSGVTMPLCAFLAVYADEVVLIFLGHEWVSATSVFRIMAIAAFLRPAVGTSSFVMLTSGQSRRYFWTGLAGGVSLAALFGVMIWLADNSQEGADYLAWAHVISTYALVIPKLQFSFKKTPITLGLFGAAIAKPIIASLVCAALLLGLKRLELTVQPIPTVILGLLAMGPGYLGLWCLLPGGYGELRQLITDFSGPISPLKFLRNRKARPA